MKQGGRQQEGNLRKPLKIWHIISRAVSQMNRLNCAVGGRTQTNSATVNIFWRFTQACCEKTIRFTESTAVLRVSSASFTIISRETPINACVSQAFFDYGDNTKLVDADACGFSLYRKDESLQWGWNRKHDEKSLSLINNLKIPPGFGVLGKPNPCREGVPAGCLMSFCSLFSFFSILTMIWE